MHEVNEVTLSLKILSFTWNLILIDIRVATLHGSTTLKRPVQLPCLLPVSRVLVHFGQAYTYTKITKMYARHFVMDVNQGQDYIHDPSSQEVS